jgi:carboxypeptidase C (cathepsin A)
VVKETGTLNGLYYVFYRSSMESTAPSDVPVILWLSGGPGCSGIIALLFENGPCMFDDEAETLALNPYSWTTLAHVIYVDQPRGTGFSDDGDSTSSDPWTQAQATKDLHGMLDSFFVEHADLRGNDFYVFGESFAGHYVPDLAASLLSDDADERYTITLKGIGIGNGVVSTSAVADSFVPFAYSNSYGRLLLGSESESIRAAYDTFRASMSVCTRENSSAACAVATDDYENLRGLTAEAVVEQGWNVYDMRRTCHTDDNLGLCYRFSLIQDFVNRPDVLQYFGEPEHSWHLCAAGMGKALSQFDTLAESESRVASLLERGVRVLVYAGDADTVVNWHSHELWTRALHWSHQSEFQAAALSDLRTTSGGGFVVGQVQSSHGLSLVKIAEAGHVCDLRGFGLAVSTSDATDVVDWCCCPADGAARPARGVARAAAALHPRGRRRRVHMNFAL